MKFDTMQEQFKNEKLNKKQLQTNLNTLEEELAEMKVICNNFEKVKQFIENIFLQTKRNKKVY
jgi:hypothetical protein